DLQPRLGGLIGEEVAELAHRGEAPFLFASVRDGEIGGVEAAGAVIALRQRNVDVRAVRVLRDSAWVGGICHVKTPCQAGRWRSEERRVGKECGGGWGGGAGPHDGGGRRTT